MKLKAGFAAAVLGLALAGGAFADKTITITGPVIRYTPGQTIVIRGEGNREITYTLHDVDVPPDLAIGKTVTVYTEPGSGKELRVTRVALAGGGTETTTTTTERSLDDDKYMTVTGTVTTYDAGKTVTIHRADGTDVTYTLSPSAEVPSDLVTGKTVTVKTTKTTTTTGSPTVERIIYTTKTKTTIKK